MKSSRDKTLPERTEKALLHDLANMRDDGIGAFRHKWDRFYAVASDEELLTRRDELRRVWVPRFNRLDQFLDFLETPGSLGKDRSAGLQEFAADNFPAEPIQKVVCEHWLSIAKEPWIVKWGRQRALRANPRCLPAVLALGCIRHADRFGRCRNPDCPAPYYFRGRRDQRYCSSDCASPAKRAAKLRWWNANRSKKHSNLVRGERT